MKSLLTSVRFHLLIPFSLPKRTSLKESIHSLFVSEKKELWQLDYIFCSDEFLLKLNQDFLNHDTYTDIITFDMSDKADKSITGEIYISIERVRENAKQFNAPFQHELSRVIFHGALHLCGYKDKSTIQKKVMTEKENDYLVKHYGSTSHNA